jgi:hypothetical protein
MDPGSGDGEDAMPEPHGPSAVAVKPRPKRQLVARADGTSESGEAADTLAAVESMPSGIHDRGKTVAGSAPAGPALHSHSGEHLSAPPDVGGMGGAGIRFGTPPAAARDVVGAVPAGPVGLPMAAPVPQPQTILQAAAGSDWEGVAAVVRAFVAKLASGSLHEAVLMYVPEMLCDVIVPPRTQIFLPLMAAKGVNVAMGVFREWLAGGCRMERHDGIGVAIAQSTALKMRPCGYWTPPAYPSRRFLSVRVRLCRVCPTLG